MDVLVDCFKNAGAALTRGRNGDVFGAGGGGGLSGSGGGFGLREERSRLDTRLTDRDTRLTDRSSRSLKESRRNGGTLSLRSLRSALRSSRFSL